MSELIAHPKTKADLDAIVEAPRACYMLVGPRYSGKLASALYVAEKLHSDQFDRLHLKPNEKGSITIEMAHDLVSSLGKRPNRKQATRVVIIESAERMSIPAQNALLKVIEEPPANTIFLLLVTNTQGVLSTIKSRCQTIYIRPVANLPEVARGRAGLAMHMADHPEQNDIQLYIMSRAEEILSASPFERMVLAEKFANDKDKDEIVEALTFLVSKAARQQNASSQALQSMQNYFIYSSAGVANKHALMEMMIRL